MRPQVGVPANSPVNPSPGSQHHVSGSLQTIAVFTLQTPFLTPTSQPTKSCPNWSFVSKVNVVAVLSSKFWSNLWLSQENQTKMLMYWSHYRKKKQTLQLCPCLFQCHQMLQMKIWGALNLHLVSSNQSPAFSMSALQVNGLISWLWVLRLESLPCSSSTSFDRSSLIPSVPSLWYCRQLPFTKHLNVSHSILLILVLWQPCNNNMDY